MSQVILKWVKGLGDATLVTKDTSKRTTIPVLARIYIKQNEEDYSFDGWAGRIYVSFLGPKENILSHGTFTRDTFKKTAKEIEWELVRWFKKMGLELVIEAPDFLNEAPYTLDKRKLDKQIPQTVN